MYLAALGSTAVAGCVGTGSDDGSDATDAASATPTGTGDATQTETESASIEGTATETMTTEEQSISQKLDADAAGSVDLAGLATVSDVQWDAEKGAVTGTIENASDAVLGRVRNRLTFLDDGGDLVAKTSESIRFVRSGSTYQFALPFTGSDASAAASFRLDARVWSEALGTVADGQVSVSGDQFTQFEGDGHGVEGTVTNDSDEDLFRVLPHVNFYDGDELLAYGSTAITNLEAGNSADWQVAFPGESADAVGDYQVVVLIE